MSLDYASTAKDPNKVRIPSQDFRTPEGTIVHNQEPLSQKSQINYGASSDAKDTNPTQHPTNPKTEKTELTTYDTLDAKGLYTDAKVASKAMEEPMVSFNKATSQGELVLVDQKTRIEKKALTDAYNEIYAVDPKIRDHVIESYMAELALEIKPSLPEGSENLQLVDRRAPVNPLSRKKKGVYSDPALRNNPLRGRLIALLSTSAALTFVFLQALILNKTRFGTTMTSKTENPMFGPHGETLFDLGGLSTNAIRNDGDIYRIFWAAWMHSGWLHIIFNVLCQMQFFFMFEPDWGFWRSFLVFWVSGVAGNLLSSTADPCTITVGSSGGLFGLMGGMVPYCIEYWNTIPRPACTLVFSIIVLVISILIGFSTNTDNWAHMGGLLGGILFGLFTITTLSALEGCRKKEPTPGADVTSVSGGPEKGVAHQQKKKRIHRSTVTRQFQLKVQPKCKCGIAEWIVRIFALVGLVVYFVLTFLYLLSIFVQPLGHVSFSETTTCLCCYLNLEGIQDPGANGVAWACFGENQELFNTSWKTFCGYTNEELRNLNLTAIDAIGRKIPIKK